jgi:hypothetical protein
LAAIVALSMSRAIARLWLKRRSGVLVTLREGSSSQLRFVGGGHGAGAHHSGGIGTGELRFAHAR